MFKCIFMGLSILPICLAASPGSESLDESTTSLYINDKWFDFTITQEVAQEIASLTCGISDGISASDAMEGIHKIKQIIEAGKSILLEDGSQWLVGATYRNTSGSWKPDQRLKLTYHSQHTNNMHLENIDTKDFVWGVNEKKPQPQLSPFILRLGNTIFDSSQEMKLILNNGLILKGPKVAWKVRDAVFVLRSASGGCELWNLSKNETSSPWKIVGNEKEGSIESAVNLEHYLNQHVLGQEEVSKILSKTIFNCLAGLNNPDAPLGVFLFLGPTGVGKTEMAKTLTQALYHDQKHLIRFDMSQFPSMTDYTRLIGSPPGFVNHEEGGQLTEALRKQPQAVVLLDEIEKANWQIRKAFLPVFDEGYINDSKNRRITCNRAIFVMTGNICSDEIAQLFNEGSTSEEIIKIIEPSVISQISPELYNRVTTVVFRPITAELMRHLVNQKLNEIGNYIKKQKGMQVIFDDTVKSYLMKHGYHPTLGVRPLKRLIQNKVVAAISYAIVIEGIPEGSVIYVSYREESDSLHITWESKIN